MFRPYHLVALVLLSPGVSHAVVVYDESISGDLSDFPPPYDSIVLAEGANEIIGNISYMEPVGSGSYVRDNDRFELVVGDGLQIDSYTVTITNRQVITTGSLIRVDGSFSAFGDFKDPFLYYYGSALPLPWDVQQISSISAGPGAYIAQVGTNGYGYGGNTPGFDKIANVNWDYTVTVGVSAVSAVPAPAAVWLFGSGLLGLIGVARRRTA